MHDPERDIRDIPLSQLELSPDNVRKTPADASAFTELKASIAAHGLLENLIARAMDLLTFQGFYHKYIRIAN